MKWTGTNMGVQQPTQPISVKKMNIIKLLLVGEKPEGKLIQAFREVTNVAYCMTLFQFGVSFPRISWSH